MRSSAIQLRLVPLLKDANVKKCVFHVGEEEWLDYRSCSKWWRPEISNVIGIPVCYNRVKSTGENGCDYVEMRKKMGDISFFVCVCSDLPRANRHLLADHLQRSFLDALHNRRRRNQRENYDVKLGTFLKKKRKMAKIGWHLFLYHPSKSFHMFFLFFFSLWVWAFSFFFLRKRKALYIVRQ